MTVYHKSEFFEFKDYEQAFARFFELKQNDDYGICFVVSTHDYSSGYWIEINTKDSSSAYVYRTQEAVERLQRRLTEKQSRTVNLALGELVN